MKRLYNIANWIGNKIGIRGDYILHYTLCMLITYIVGLTSFTAFYLFTGYNEALVASLFGAVFSLGVGTGKEYGDHVNPNNKWCWKDMLANFLGILTGLLILYTVIIIIL